MNVKRCLVIVASGLLLTGCGNTSSEGNYSRGIGVYPGNPQETFAPELVEASDDYRNVAMLKAAYHSSSYDYNLTAQLVTDGIVTSDAPAYIQVSTQNGPLKKNEREWLFDSKSDSKYTISGNDIYLQLDVENMPVHADKMVLQGNVTLDNTLPQGYELTASVSADGKEWEIIDQKKSSTPFGIATPQRSFRMGSGTAQQGKSPVVFKYDYKEKKVEQPAMFRANAAGGNVSSRTINYEVALDAAKGYKYFKVAVNMPAAMQWNFHTWDFFQGDEWQSMLPATSFRSAWRSVTAGNEWLYIDFGTTVAYDKLNIHWINKATKGSVLASDDAKSWEEIAQLPGGSNRNDVIELGKNVKSRYIRLSLTEAEGGKPYELSELEVWGKGGLKAQPAVSPAPTAEKQLLSGGNWKLQRASLIEAAGEVLSTAGYDDNNWVTATVPGTVLSSFYNIGALPDPNYADNQLQISDSYFISDFWYRNEFTVSNPAKQVFLNFNGVNWKADIYLNGKYVGRIDGAFMRGKFDVSKEIVQGDNYLAVKIIKNAHPGAIKEQTAFSADQNGGVPGADNPTFHASIGWDWIPTIRGRNIGIWNDVFLTYNGPVTIEDPFIRSELPLPDTNSADLFVEVTLKNHTGAEVSGILKGKYGETAFEQPVTLAANETKLVKLDPTTTPALHLENPKLWWPVGYGEPHLYDVDLAFDVNGKQSDHTAFKSGVRQMTFSEDEYEPYGGRAGGFGSTGTPRRLSLFVNGKRFVGFGGNWGFSESNLNYRGREYDIAVKYHADMNFTMIRNWVGQIGDEEFYEACDRHGVMVWQDFWLANPVDGPNPYYVEMFHNNAKDYVKRIRNHPSIGIYVGRNEGNPPAEIDDYLRAMVPQEHPGMHYISHSAAGVVSGGGTYRAMEPIEYFRLHGHDKFHSERGMPNVMTYENMKRAFGEENLMPINTVETPNSIYGLHDYTMNSAQGGDSFNKMMEKAFGKPKDAKQFAEWAQWINYNGYRAIFEGRSEHRRGMLLWMSHPAWPSMVWQTYDYYFEPTGAYFGCKKACEPLHIQWNPLRDDIEVVNYHPNAHKGLTAKAQLINQDGSVQWEKVLQIDIEGDQTVACFPLEQSEKLSATYFIKLTLTENGKVVSDNFYWRGKEDGNFKSLLTVPQTTLNANWNIQKVGDEWQISGTVKNDTDVPALMVRLKAVGDKTGELLLPVMYSDNYFFLMPGEEKAITISLADVDTYGEKPVIEINGFNI